MLDLAEGCQTSVRQILRQHVPDCEVRAFGSRVTGGARSYSDLDLALVGDTRLDPARVDRLREAFQASNLPIRVDVLDWHAISPSFQDVIGAKFEIIQAR